MAVVALAAPDGNEEVPEPAPVVARVVPALGMGTLLAVSAGTAG